MREKSLIEGECELNYQKNREQRGKKDSVFLHISTILTPIMCKLCLSLWTFDNSITKELHVIRLSLASVNRINAQETMRDIFMSANCYHILINVIG